MAPSIITTFGSIVVVAKCPIPGKSKTRLAPWLGETGAADLAKAMLCDVLMGLSTTPHHVVRALSLERLRHAFVLSNCFSWYQNPVEFPNVDRILLFAPSARKDSMDQILEELGLHDQWTTIPMLEEDGPNNLQSSDLGQKLTHALVETRGRRNDDNNKGGPVIFLGMDSPEVPLDEVASALTNPDQVLLCPALDGGYGLLSVPAHVNAHGVFLPLSSSESSSSRWSTSLTAVAQLKALTDAKATVRLGRLMQDMDEQQDIESLCQRFQQHDESTETSSSASTEQQNQTAENQDCLLRSSSGGTSLTASCTHTRDALRKLGQL